MEALQHQNHELKAVIEGLQKKFSEFVESSKANLMESGQKWFMFSREIYAIAKKHLRKESMGLLDKYDSFFLGSMDEHIEANEISLFDKHSYVNEDVSMPDQKQRSCALTQPASTASRSARWPTPPAQSTSPGSAPSSSRPTLRTVKSTYAPSSRPSASGSSANLRLPRGEKLLFSTLAAMFVE